MVRLTLGEFMQMSSSDRARNLDRLDAEGRRSFIEGGGDLLTLVGCQYFDGVQAPAAIGKGKLVQFPRGGKDGI